MQKLNLTQSLSQKLSPQQIQFIKLLQVPTAELDKRIEEELEINPALEETKEDEEYGDSPEDTYEDNYEESYDSSESYGEDEYGEKYEESYDSSDINVSEYLNDDAGYKMQGDGFTEEEDRDMPLAMGLSLTDSLLDQLGYLELSEKQYAIGKQLIGSIDSEGYIRRELEGIVNDLAFTQNVYTDLDEVIQVLKKIQQFDPPGIAARDLKECLELQLYRKNQKQPEVNNAIRILTLCFEEFIKKHYQKITKRLNITEEDLKNAVNMIVKLNPKPGGNQSSYVKNQYIIPDFILKATGRKLTVVLNSRNAPDLRISRGYADMLDAYDKSDKKDKKMKQTVAFVKQKLDAAKWFIDAIKQRQQTLLRTMDAIVDYQHEFFMEGDESKLKPMILKDIANKISMDISTVSRVANSKSIQTDHGIYPLKFFFSESIQTDTGEDVSSKEVKYILKQIIESESKRKPYSDDKLEKLLNIKGYNIARRTVAKYREQMNIPVARLRKEL